MINDFPFFQTHPDRNYHARLLTEDEAEPLFDGCKPCGCKQRDDHEPVGGRFILILSKRDGPSFMQRVLMFHGSPPCDEPDEEDCALIWNGHRYYKG